MFGHAPPQQLCADRIYWGSRMQLSAGDKLRPYEIVTRLNGLQPDCPCVVKEPRATKVRSKATQVGTLSKTGRFRAVVACLVALIAIGCIIAAAQTPNSVPITITLTGQSMIRSDIRETAPAAVPVIQGLLKGDVVFTNFEATVAEKGETVNEGRGFLAPPEALDALRTFGFNLLSLSNNHAFDLKVTGIRNTIREADSRKIVRAGTGKNLIEAASPGYLRTAKGTIALIASASGLITPGGRATG